MYQAGISELSYTGGISINNIDTTTDVGWKYLSLHCQSEKLLQPQIALD